MLAISDNLLRSKQHLFFDLLKLLENFASSYSKILVLKLYSHFIYASIYIVLFRCSFVALYCQFCPDFDEQPESLNRKRDKTEKRAIRLVQTKQVCSHKAKLRNF